MLQMARSKKACIIFFDEVDAIGGARFDDGAGGDNEVQRTMLEIVNQLDGFDARGNIKVCAPPALACALSSEARGNQCRLFARQIAVRGFHACDLDRNA